MTTKNHGLRVGASAAMLGAILATGAASANSLTLSFGSHRGAGGEFLATSTDGWSASIAANYVAGAKGSYNGNLGFETFCLEKDEYFNPGSAYNYEINGNATALGGGRNTDSGDHLSVATGYLYKMFATGGLTGYGYDSNTRAGQLQDAFWTLENEQSTTIATWLQDILRNEFGASSTLADWRLDTGTSLTANAVMSATTYGVDVINVGSAPSFGNQDQLVYIGPSRTQRVPDGGTTLALLGITLGAMGAARRKLGRRAS